MNELANDSALLKMPKLRILISSQSKDSRSSSGAFAGCKYWNPWASMLIRRYHSLQWESRIVCGEKRYLPVAV